MNPGLIGGIIGAIVGVAGGALGTYMSIRNSRGPLERALMVRSAVVAWIAVVIFVGLMLVLPSPYRYLLWVPYGILLPLGIARVNRRVREIRDSEQGGAAQL